MKPSRGTQRRKADALFSRVVRARGRCEASGLDDVRCGGWLETAHIEGRRNHRLRWELRNALCLCAGHHRYYTGRPVAWVELVKRHFPAQYRFVRDHRHELWDRDYDRTLSELMERL